MVSVLSNTDITKTIINYVGNKSYLSFCINTELINIYTGISKSKETCKFIINAIIESNLEKVQYLIDNYEHGIKINKLCDIAAKYGKLASLEYFHENGYTWNKDTCAIAAENGNLECLEYLHKNGCPWDSKTCHYAAKNGYLSCLKYAATRNL